MATTRSRPRGRETARPNSGGALAGHMGKVWGIALGGVVLILAFLTLTGIGHVIDLAVQHFMLFYAGVFALIGLCASVGAGLIATDRIVLHPGHRVWVQAAHRAISFGALAFLVIHIVTEILAQRSHVIDAVVPFLSPFRTFYIGLGTIASDLIILLVVTSIFRKRFITHGKNAWGWRAIHYTSYAALVFGVWHGLLGGRPGKPYVDWSYGFVIAFVALGLAVRILANSLRPRETLSAPPVGESGGSASAPLRAAALLARLGSAQVGTAQVGTAQAQAPAPMTALGGTPRMLPEAGPVPGPPRVLRALPAGSGFTDTIIEDMPVYESGYEEPAPRYQGGPPPVSGPMPVVPGNPVVPSNPVVPGNTVVPSSPISGPLPQVPGGRGPQAPVGGAHQRPRTGPMPRVPDVFRDPDADPAGRPPGGRPWPQVPGRGRGPRPRPGFSGGDGRR